MAKIVRIHTLHLDCGQPHSLIAHAPQARQVLHSYRFELRGQHEQLLGQLQYELEQPLSDGQRRQLGQYHQLFCLPLPLYLRLSRLEQQVRRSEGRHSGEICVCVEAGLPLSYLWRRLSARQRALTLFGQGLSSMIGQGYNGIKPPGTGALNFGPLADIPVIGTILFRHDWMVYGSILIIAAVWAVLKYSRAGLVLRAVGESAEAAHALGYKVVRIRVLAILFGGAMAGLGGAYVSLVRVPQWTDGITAGAGWIALAIVVFASWKPWRVLLGAYLFGGITVLQLNLQAAGARIPVEYLSMSPYLITILVLVIMSSGKGRASLNAPAALGQTFHASR